MENKFACLQLEKQCLNQDQLLNDYYNGILISKNQCDTLIKTFLAQITFHWIRETNACFNGMFNPFERMASQAKYIQIHWLEEYCALLSHCDAFKRENYRMNIEHHYSHYISWSYQLRL